MHNKKEQQESNQKVEKDLLKEYESQSESEDIHFEHVDWTYSDGSGCCC